MSLTAGHRIAGYEIVGLIGAGGMGEVYRARDAKLKRDVAVKVLPEAFAGDPERMARFQREAEVLASLNHPNIAHIYGVEDRALVMELVEGESPQGPLPFDEAWKIASQIADALDYAHEKGIVHRDLKPANVKVTAEGVVKLLDFGLAKAFTGPAAVSPNPDNSPTLTLGATQLGVILGTAGYMAPEQAKGKTVDKRADIWSFGVVLYELLTGERLFQGEDVSDTLAQVLTKEPDLARAPAQTRKLLRRCLEKDPKKRLRDIGEAGYFLEEPRRPEIAAPPRRRRSVVDIFGWAVAVLALVALGYVGHRHYTEEIRVMRVSLLTPEKADLSSPLYIPAISPDGRHVAFVALADGQRALWVRDLDGLNARLLPGTNNAVYPFWSPDSRWVGFFDGSKLKKIDITGGPALTVCEVAQGAGGTWNQDDVIVYASNLGGLFRVSASGGMPAAVSELDRAGGEIDSRYPWFLPDGRHFLYVARNADPQETRIYVDSVDAKPGSRTRREILAAASNAVYASGYLLFARESTLMAQPFDAAKARTTGDAVPIAEQIDYLPNGVAGRFSASQNGTLVYSSGASSGAQSRLTWFDRGGKALGTVGSPAEMQWPRVSPDGATIAVDRRDPSSTTFDIWLLHDLGRGPTSRFTFGPQNNEFPVWSPDSSTIAFYTLRDGTGRPYRKPSTGVGQEQRIDKEPLIHRIDDWSRDGKYLIEEVVAPKTRNDIWVFPQDGEKKPFAYINSEFLERNARLSPNVQWLAYSSDESKRDEVYVQTFPAHGGIWQVSTSGGNYPVWSRDGHELYFISTDRKLMAVEVRDAGAKFEAGVPKPLFEVRAAGYYDVSKNGRFLMLVPEEQAVTNVPITVVLNWPEMLKKK
jgi:eukaryotic-like serine/threonine-protein kinase